MHSSNQRLAILLFLCLSMRSDAEGQAPPQGLAQRDAALIAEALHQLSTLGSAVYEESKVLG